MNVNVIAHYVFLAVESTAGKLGLAMLTKLLCGVNEGTSATSDYSDTFDGRMLKNLPYFGILKAPHARFDCVIVLIHKLKCAGFLEEYTVFIPELSVRNNRLAYRLTISSRKALQNLKLPVFVTCIKYV